MVAKSLNYDVIVVGGGPAGSSAAYEVANRNYSVALLEKEKTISETVRTSGVTWMETVEEFDIPRSCYNPISKYSFKSPQNEATISDTKPRAAVLDVRKTYRWLADKAKDAGADVFVNTTVRDTITDGNGKLKGVLAKKENSEINFFAKLIVDASGFNSIVARSLGLVEKWKRFGVGAEVEAKVEHVQSDSWWLMVGNEYSPSGYAWIFPVSDTIARIGVGIGRPESPADPTKKLEELLRNKDGPIKELGKITPIEYHYGLIPNEGVSRETVFDNLILVGDSAGQANPLVLEGIRYAIKFGRLAGRVGAAAIQKKDTTKQALLEYETEWRRLIQSKINSAGRVQTRWLSLTDTEWDKELDVIKELDIEEFIDFIKADFGLTNMVKLATHHPKLIVRQLFSIVKNAAK